MKHQQILDKLAASYLVKSLDEDLARILTKAISFNKHGSIPSIEGYVLPLMMKRWNCALKADETEVKKYYKEILILALAVLLHKYGITDASITKQAVKSIDILNEGVVLSDDFFRKSEEIKTFLKSIPKPLTKRPSLPESITFYRAGDVVSIQLENKYYCAYILEIIGVNGSPVIEFYDQVFDKRPNVKDVLGLKARGMKLNDGKRYISRHSVYGMKYQPDLANQVHLLAACVAKEDTPDNSHLKMPDGLYTVNDYFNLQDVIERMYG